MSLTEGVTHMYWHVSSVHRGRDVPPGYALTFDMACEKLRKVRAYAAHRHPVLYVLSVHLLIDLIGDDECNTKQKPSQPAEVVNLFSRARWFSTKPTRR